MENKPTTLEETKNVFKNLKTDPKSVQFSEEKINKGLFKKLKKSTYVKDKLFLKLINLIENGIDLSIKQRTIIYQQGLIMLKKGKLTTQYYVVLMGLFSLSMPMLPT